MNRVKQRALPLGLASKAAIVLRNLLIDLRLWRLRKLVGMDIGQNTKISLGADLDMTNPRGVHIGDGALIASHADFRP